LWVRELLWVSTPLRVALGLCQRVSARGSPAVTYSRAPKASRKAEPYLGVQCHDRGDDTVLKTRLI